MAIAFAMVPPIDIWLMQVSRRVCAITRIALAPMASAILAFEPRR